MCSCLGKRLLKHTINLIKPGRKKIEAFKTLMYTGEFRKSSVCSEQDAGSEKTQEDPKLSPLVNLQAQ